MHSDKTLQILNPNQLSQSDHRVSIYVNEMVQNLLVENLVKIIRFLDSLNKL